MATSIEPARLFNKALHPGPTQRNNGNCGFVAHKALCWANRATAYDVIVVTSATSGWRNRAQWAKNRVNRLLAALVINQLGGYNH